ncbi:MAG: DUF2892 domain-containing protein [Acidobacteriota bacterium]|nr:DUF2892 domain-containing protein [Acidobacteriota bacterium]
MSFSNENEIERVVRVTIGVVLLVLGWSGVVDDLWGVAFKLLGWFPLITGAIGWCPLYAMLDYNSRKGDVLGARRGK